MQKPQLDSRLVHLISLGCARNRVDAEVMLGTLFGKGWSHTEDPSQAEAIIVNTCGFIEAAKEESIDTILEAAEFKKENKELKLVVTGCLTQRYKHQLSKGLPEVDFFIGTDEFTKIGELLDRPPERGSVIAKRTHYLYNEKMPRVNTLAKYSAYVKVAEGCQHNCAFCIIPAIRGRLRSRPISSIVAEVKELARQGVKEINLIAQDLAAYGRDLGEDQLLPLLQQLVNIEGIEWIRPLYVYPENISEEFLDFFANQKKIVKYIDIPVQHASNSVLDRMNRQVDQDLLRATITKLRNRVPGIAIRTSVMVGFPGESDQEFQELLAFVREMKFEHLGCFSYSKEDGTVAGRMVDQVDEEVKESRLAQVMLAQQEVSRLNLESFVGQKFDALVLGPSSESDLLWEARLSTQAPEIDGTVYINEGEPVAGAIQKVEITESHEYDLIARILD